MADLMAKGLAWLAPKLQAQAGADITYGRGAHSVPLRAVLGKTLLHLLDAGGGVRVEWTDGDFGIVAAELVLDGVATEPQRLDEIRLVVRGETVVFEVNAEGGEPPWRWADEHRTMMRVHAKEVGRE